MGSFVAWLVATVISAVSCAAILHLEPSPLQALGVALIILPWQFAGLYVGSRR